MTTLLTSFLSHRQPRRTRSDEAVAFLRVWGTVLPKVTIC